MFYGSSWESQARPQHECCIVFTYNPRTRSWIHQWDLFMRFFGGCFGGVLVLYDMHGMVAAFSPSRYIASFHCCICISLSVQFLW